MRSMNSPVVRFSIAVGPLLMACVLFAAASSLAAAEPGSLERIEVYPRTVLLSSRRSYSQTVVTMFTADGDSQDLTDRAEFTIRDQSVATADGARIVPVKDGTTILDVGFGSFRKSVLVTVSHQNLPDPVSFRSEVLAVLTRQGCNAGSCHGSPKGKNGFSLSLMGYSAELDEEALIQGGLARRTNPIEPFESLLLKKPMLRIPHVGGKRLRKSDTAFQILHNWIAEGATNDPPGSPICEGIIVAPHDTRVLQLPEGEQQLSVQARFSDGTMRDVTRIATYTSSDKDVVTCSAHGVVYGHERGFGAVMVRYLSHVESVYFTVMEDIEGFHWNDPSSNNYIDELVHARLRQLQYVPSGLADDTTFVRRIYLDLTGLLPTPVQARIFLSDVSDDTRVRLIDQLLESTEFARFWANKTADVMRLNKQNLPDGRAELFAGWLRSSWKNNQPFNEFTEALLTASGDTKTTAPANYFFAVPQPEDLTETTAQLFMGSRIGCAKCHNHPFENWTQDDYYRIAAVFVRTKNKAGMIVLNDEGEARNPQTGEMMTPWGAEHSSDPAGTLNNDRRATFTKWLTDRKNPFFSRVEVNRIWFHLMGRGIVEPIDDVRSSNPPSNPELLDALAVDFQRNVYDRRHIIRTICNSRTYQRSAATVSLNGDDTTFFSHYLARQLSAEQLQDAIGFVSKTIGPTNTIADNLQQSSAELEARLEALPGDYSQWETGIATQLAGIDCWQGTWRTTDSFGVNSFDEAVEAKHGPEVDLNVSWESTWKKGKKKWRKQPVWIDGAQHVTLSGGAGPRYIARRIYATKPGQAKVTFGTTGGVKIWLNREMIHDDPTDRPIKSDNQRLTFELAAGINTLLIKTINSSMLWGFQYELVTFEETPPKTLKVTLDAAGELTATTRGLQVNRSDTLSIDVDIAELVVIPADSRTQKQAAKLVWFQETTNPQVAKLRNQVARLTDWLDYQTLRTWPQMDSQFLSAFGQPARESPCACERRSEPTIDQSLQMLNGDLVREHTAQGARHYSRNPDNHQMLTDIYFAALMRPPREQEEAAALTWLEKHPDREAAVADILWAVINTREFQFQH